MKIKLTRRILASFIVITTVLLFSILSLKAENAHKHDKAHQHGEHAAAGEKVRCAFSGMMMKPSAMVKVDLDGKAYYFCNDMQADMFKANPEKYLQTISVGNLTFDLNVLTTDAYKDDDVSHGNGGHDKSRRDSGENALFQCVPDASARRNCVR